MPFDPCVIVVWLDGIWDRPSGKERFHTEKHGEILERALRFLNIFEVWEGCNDNIIPPQETEKQVEIECNMCLELQLLSWKTKRSVS